MILESLQNCSLVAGSRTSFLRCVLEAVERLSELTLRTELNNSPPKNVGVLRDVRSLSAVVDLSPHEHPEALARFLHIAEAEAVRIHQVTIGHQALEYGWFTIFRVRVTPWATCRDEEVYSNPEIFCPQRSWSIHTPETAV